MKTETRKLESLIFAKSTCCGFGRIAVMVWAFNPQMGAASIGHPHKPRPHKRPGGTSWPMVAAAQAIWCGA